MTPTKARERVNEERARQLGRAPHAHGADGASTRPTQRELREADFVIYSLLRERAELELRLADARRDIETIRGDIGLAIRKLDRVMAARAAS